MLKNRTKCLRELQNFLPLSFKFLLSNGSLLTQYKLEVNFLTKLQSLFDYSLSARWWSCLVGIQYKTRSNKGLARYYIYILCIKSSPKCSYVSSLFRCRANEPNQSFNPIFFLVQYINFQSRFLFVQDYFQPIYFNVILIFEVASIGWGPSNLSSFLLMLLKNKTSTSYPCKFLSNWCWFHSCNFFFFFLISFLTTFTLCHVSLSLRTKP